MRNNKLTPAQEAFCRKYLETFIASEAFRFAYPKSRKWMDKSVWEKASAMLHNAKVSARIKELQQQQKAKFDITRDEIASMALNIAKDGLKASDRIKAMDLISKLFGFYAPIKQEVTGKDGQPLHPEPLTITIVDPKEENSDG